MATSPHILIDIQFLQTGAYERGMGRYFVGLLGEMLPLLQGGAKVFCLYGKGMPDQNIFAFKEEVAGMRGGERVEFAGFDFMLHNFEDDNYSAAYAHNLTLVEEFLSRLPKSIKKTWFVPSLMQEPVVPVLPAQETVQKVILWHDLMPYLMHDHYFKERDTAHAKSYLRRLTLLLEADIIVTNSATTRTDLIKYISLPPHKVINIDGSVNARLAMGDPIVPSLVTKPFFLCPASPEPNKNIHRSIEAFAKFNETQDGAYQLVVTSSYDTQLAKEIKARGINVVFTGHIANAELTGLYQSATALLFMSTYEGLGMPLLEAVGFDKKIVCSDIPVFREIGPTGAFFWADPMDVEDIARALQDAAQKEKLSPAMTEAYGEIKKKYSWKNSAHAFIRTIGDQASSSKTPSRQRIAVVGPHPSSFSSIGKFIAETIPYLHDKAEVHYYYDSGPSDERHGLVRFNYLQQYRYLYPIKQLAAHGQDYAKIIYHMGNSDHHMKSYLLAHSLPGTVVLHDTDLSGDGLAGQMLSNGYLSTERVALEYKIEANYLDRPERFIASLLSTQHQIITHSSFANDVAKVYNLGNASVVDAYHPMQVVDAMRSQRDIDAPLRLGIAGIMTKVKGTDTIQWLLEQTDGLKGCHLTIFGFGFFADKDHLLRLASEYPNIDVKFDLTDFAFAEILGSMDLLINYRPVYKGEASRATLEALRDGVVPVVRDIGWYGELPDAVGYKLQDIEQLAELISRLGESPRKARQELAAKREAGKRLLQKQYGLDDYINHLVGKTTND